MNDNIDNKNKYKSKLPFSKKIVEYSRLEAWLFSIILIVLVCFNKDVSALTDLITVSWVGYNALKLAYVWLVKHEHIYDKKIELIHKNKTENKDNLFDVEEIINDINNEIDE